MSAGDILLDDDGNRMLESDGTLHLSDGAGDGCCCNKCFEVWQVVYDCGTDSWGTVTFIEWRCLPGGTSTAWALISPCTYEKLVGATPETSCTAAGDCSELTPGDAPDVPASHADCVCCPTDCSGCGNRSVTLSGLSGLCACANGSYTLTRSGCVWSYTGATADADPLSVAQLDFRCVDGNWTFTATLLSICSNANPVLTYTGNFTGQDSKPHRPGTDDCGRTGTYTVSDTNGTTCTGQTLTAVIS